MATERYNPRASESRWQKAWDEAKLFAVANDDPRPKYYVLEMFPYPSGRIHMGHVRNYAMGDVVARFRRAMGCNVLHPMGWDAFGLPAENAARDNKVNPRDWTYANIETMKAQLKTMGLSLDWSREIATCDPSYYQHQQKMFLDFWRAGLVERKSAKVNWDPVDMTVLANEQVIDGRGWRSDALVEQRDLTQWFFKITAMAQELLDGLDTLDRWPEKVRLMQQNWIGRSEGMLIRWPIAPGTAPAGEAELEVYTTRPDTIFGASFMAIAADHPLARKAAAGNPALSKFIDEVHHMGTSLAALETAEKKGVDTGIRVVHPFDPDWTLPVYVANFVLMDYGTGAIFGCPSGDQRDLDFANKYGLPVVPVVMPEGADAATFQIIDEAYVDDGVMINSRFLDGMKPKEAFDEVARLLEQRSIGNRPMGERKVQFRLRDWLISRQRYWGCPIPVIHCDECGAVPVPDSDLPVQLPADVTFDRPGNPLDHHPTWKHVACPQCGGKARRDTDTMDTFVDSSWYFARFTDPWNDEAADHALLRRRQGRVAAGQPVYRRRRARDPAPALFALLRARDEDHRASERGRRAVRRDVHARHGRARNLQGPGRLGDAGRGQGRRGRRQAPCVADLGRHADRDRRHREDVEVEEECRRPRRHHRQLRRRYGALVHAVGFAAGPRCDLDRGRRRGRAPLRAAAVATGLGSSARPCGQSPRTCLGR